MINLQKKQGISLTKTAPALKNIRVGLSWDEVDLNGQSPDCDASVFMLGENGKIPTEEYFVFYNNLVSGDQAVKHNGDNRTGEGDGDDETIDINLSQVSPSVVQIYFVITIHNIDAGFNFGNVNNASVRIYDSSNNNIICQYELGESFGDCDSLIIGRMYRNASEWEFEALGQAYGGGLAATLEIYS